MKRTLFSNVKIKNTFTGLALALAVALTLSSPVAAQISNSGDWHDNGSWKGTVPGSTDAVTIAAGATVTVRSAANGPGAPALCNTLLIQAGGTLVIEEGAALRVSSSVTFANANGNIIPNVNLNGIVTIANTNVNATRITGHGATNYFNTGTNGRLVITNIGNTEVTFPVGTTTYTPAFVTATTGTGTFSVGVKNNVLKFATAGPQITNGVINRTWDVTKVTESSTVVTLKFKWNPSDVIGTFNLASATVVNFHNNSWNFPAMNETTVLSDDMVTRSNVSMFSPFAIQDAGINPLPVELLYFHAAKKENGILLTWETAAEKNNKGFEVQASADGRNFETTGSVATKNGNANYSQRYEFLDKASRSGLVYFRLKQTDLDGTVSYYAAKVVDMGRFTNTVAAYPNPFQNQFEVSLNAASAASADLMVTDLTGKVVYSSNQVLVKGANTVKVDLQNLPAGVYLLKTSAAGQTTVNRLVKQ